LETEVPETELGTHSLPGFDYIALNRRSQRHASVNQHGLYTEYTVIRHESRPTVIVEL